MLYLLTDADMAKLADALDLGSSSERSEGSSPFIRTYRNYSYVFTLKCTVTNYMS